VHLDLVEDPAGREGSAAPRAYSWRLSVVDGESGPRDRHDPTPSCYNNGRRDDDDDNYDNDRHGRHITRGSSWSSRLFRSLSRAPKEQERERSESRREHHRDRDYGMGGRRHQADTTSIKEQQTTRGRSRERHPRRLSGRAAVRSEPRRHRARRDETPTRRAPTSCNPASTELNRKDKSPPPSPKQKSRFRPGYVYRRRRNTTSAGTVGNEAWSGALSAPLEVAATHGLIDMSRIFSRILESLPQVQGGSSSPCCTAQRMRSSRCRTVGGYPHPLL
jgi:hypothetical protein